MNSFEELQIIPEIIEAIKKQEYKDPTPIQEKAIPEILGGKDLVGQAQTGTGKTAAFAIPTLQKMVLGEEAQNLYNRVKTIIMAPTRELAIQIGDSFKTYGEFLNVGVGVIYGGVTPKRHMKVLKKEPSIIVATPGRLRSFMEDDIIDISEVELLIIDEADRMFEFGMAEDVNYIIENLPSQRQNLLFSATMPDHILKLVNKVCKYPVNIKIESKKEFAPKIDQYVIYTEETHKAEKLIDFLHYEEYDSVMIFVRTKKKADKIAKEINVSNIRAKALHGDIGQKERMKTLQLFKDKEVKVLIATDVAARGIDVTGVTYVINFNVPNVPETYVHRIGRTGRAGEKGIAITYCSKDEKEFLKDIESLQKQKLKVKG